MSTSTDAVVALAKLVEKYNTAYGEYYDAVQLIPEPLQPRLFPQLSPTTVATATDIGGFGTAPAADYSGGESDSTTGADSAIAAFPDTVESELGIEVESDASAFSSDPTGDPLGESGTGAYSTLSAPLFSSINNAFYVKASEASDTNSATYSENIAMSFDSAEVYADIVYEIAEEIVAKLQEMQDAIDEDIDVDEALSGVDGSDAAAVNAAIAAAAAAENERIATQNAAELAAQKEAQDKLKAALAGKITKTQILYQEQCFLMSQIISLIAYKKKNLSPTKPIPYQGSANNVCILAQDQPFHFMNKLTQYPGAEYLFRIKPQNLSNLVPMIRLYKISTNDNTGEDSEIEFQFNSNPTFTEIQNYVKDKTKRGFGAGIKDFSFTYDGSNPFSAKKSIRAKLTIFANGFDELFMCRGNEKCDSTDPDQHTGAYRYIDLALKTGRGTSIPETICEEARTNLSKLHFRLKAVVGWAMPKGFPNELDDFDLLDAINNSFVTLNLTPTIHEFNIEEDGRVGFTINYLAYIDEFFDQPQFNIFSDTTVATTMTLRKLILENITHNGECSSSEIAELKKLETDEIALEKKNSLTYLTTKLTERGDDGKSKMKFINLKREELLKYQNSGVFYTLPDGGVESLIVDDVTDPAALTAAQNQAAEDNPPKEKEGSEEESLAFEKLILEPGSEQIPFFFVSDLVDIILEGIGVKLSTLPGLLDADPAETLVSGALVAGVVDTGMLQKQISEEKKMLAAFYKRFKKLRVVLGPVEVRDPAGSGWEKNGASLGDLPVSYKYFLEWLTKKMLSKEDSTYHLAQFLNDLINTLIKQFMNSDSCFKTNKSQQVRLQQTTLTSYAKEEGDPDDLVALMKIQDDTRIKVKEISPLIMPVLNISGLKDTPIVGPIDRETNYMIFFAGRTQPDDADLFQGDRYADELAGIFHYSMGRADGLVKKISLSKTDAKFLKEVRFEQEGYDGLKQLREVYDVQIDAFPIVNAYPGVYIYVDPKGWLPNAGTPGSNVTLDLTQYGIGGYHMIWKSTHSFAPGRAESQIYAKWVAAIGASDTTTCAGAVDNTGVDPANSKCATVLAEVAKAEAATTTSGDEVGENPDG